MSKNKTIPCTKNKSTELRWHFLDASSNFIYLFIYFNFLSILYLITYSFHLNKLFEQTAQVKEVSRQGGLCTERPHPGGHRVQTFSPAETHNIISHKPQKMCKRVE